MQRIDVGDADNIGDKRTGGRPSSRPDRDPSLLGEVNKIPNDQDVTDEPSLLEHAEFVIEPLTKFVVDLGAFAIAINQTFLAEFTQITFTRLAFWHRILRILRFPELKIEMTTFADL